jgi:hypothetical protein
MIETAGDIITAALKTSGVVGVGQTPLAEDANDALDLLREIAGTWNQEVFMCWRNVELIIPATGAASYAIPDRPPRLDSAFARQAYQGSVPAITASTSPVDYQMAIIDSQADYNTISLKYLTSFPAAVWYQSDYPTGMLTFWPVPVAGQYELHVFYRDALPAYTALTDPLGLPLEYIMALRYELALRIQLNYGLPANRSHVASLMGTKATIKANNARMSTLSMPAGLATAASGQGGISGSVGPHQSVIVLDSGLPVLG